MKKVLSVALASSMVLGLGMNAFALEYNSGSNDTANWPSNFKFEGSLFVTDEDDNLVTTSSTALGTKEAADFRPGDVIWMPLYADNQKVYGVAGNQQGYPAVSATTVTLRPSLVNTTEGAVQIVQNGVNAQVADFTYSDTTNKVLYYYGAKPAASQIADGYRIAKITNVDIYLGNTIETRYANLVSTVGQDDQAMGNVTFQYNVTGTAATGFTIGVKTSAGAAISGSITTTPPTGYTAVTYTDAQLIAFVKDIVYGGNNPTAATAGDLPISVPNQVIGTKVSTGDTLLSNVTVKAQLPSVPEIVGSDGKILVGGELVEGSGNNFNDVVAHGPYTGNIDKNWSINLLEKTKGAEELIDSAEFYRADASDVAMYGNRVVANAVYVKVTLKDFFDSVSDATLKYYVYVADNDGSKNDKTNEVWVEGKYMNEDEKYVDFDWSNNANSPAVWKVRKGENGTAVFDFKDKVFFTVKMYSEEKMYLDLNTAYDKIVAGDFSEADFDSFFKFKGTNANFSREGQLLLASDDEDLFVYEIDADGNLIPVDAEYVKDYKIAHTNTKANGYLFNTKELGNYVLSATELEADEEEAPEEEPEDNNNDVVEEPTTPDETEKPAPTPEKPNPNTGANDFVGVAVALAVVSVAAAGALALKK